MPGKRIMQQLLEASSPEILRPTPARLFLISVATIFMAEAMVMLIIHFVGLPNTIYTVIFDATVLSLIIIPVQYLLLFRPMRDALQNVEHAKSGQAELEKIDEMKNEFISVVSHELTNPVTAIVGYTELAIDSDDLDSSKEYLDVIMKKAKTIERMIDDLQAANHVDSGRNLAIVKQLGNISDIVVDQCKTYRAKFPEKNILLNLPGNPVVFQFDAVRISQVFDNLLSNAVKYSDASDDQVEVSLIDQGDFVKIQVRDQGVGMSPEEQTKVFEKFYRASSEISDVGGLGLGLTIVREIVHGHNGNIEVASRPQVGTTFSITLPV
ncbi:MAG: hypothetical protein C0616_15205 [Desulfuromonas sp.]|nr:MAG: hypothetical protein C0616_15205 [Desulfuromonas sp.]